MVNKITDSQRLFTVNSFDIELDRIAIFVQKISEIDNLRELDFHHFEFAIRNYEQGTVSHIFFFKNVNLELIRIEDLKLATQYAARTSIDFISRTRWQQNQAVPFGFVFRYAASSKYQSKRRHSQPNKLINSRQPASQINFSLKNINKLEEPACCIVPNFLTCECLLDNTSKVKERLLAYHSQTITIENVEITLNISTSLSNTFALIAELNLVKIRQGGLPKLELKLDGNNAVQTTTFTSIPLIFSC
ncbi:hypothetical protein C7B62_17900 [Pleurocapsa sp. CCALA 161]|uniref:hypothetical protein n=1 Tax=Pleurocapsa sp. CCALA 161 TaxID=2107688 RepID=UPI000D079EB2|nr:hypothetical protein [Pleurocapsa sp. CCALA 161]PSB08076.1 hypothetical protein C7B62_17900 [Pleurocapsa sp. CCALA 161]